MLLRQNSSAKERQGGIRRRFSFLAFILLLIAHGSWCQTSSALPETEEEAQQRVKEKYASILKLSPDSLKNLPMYQMLDQWPEFLTKNSARIKGKEQAVFAQYIYYLVYNTKLPGEVEQIFTDQKTYPFKNPLYLRSGDLLFYGKQAHHPDQVAVYLQNNILAYPSESGALQFVSLQELQPKFELTAAKILKDEKEAR